MPDQPPQIPENVKYEEAVEEFKKRLNTAEKELGVANNSEDLNALVEEVKKLLEERARLAINDLNIAIRSVKGQSDKINELIEVGEDLDNLESNLNKIITTAETKKERLENAARGIESKEDAVGIQEQIEQLSKEMESITDHEVYRTKNGEILVLQNKLNGWLISQVGQMEITEMIDDDVDTDENLAAEFNNPMASSYPSVRNMSNIGLWFRRKFRNELRFDQAIHAKINSKRFAEKAPEELARFNQNVAITKLFKAAKLDAIGSEMKLRSIIETYEKTKSFDIMSKDEKHQLEKHQLMVLLDFLRRNNFAGELNNTVNKALDDAKDDLNKDVEALEAVFKATSGGLKTYNLSEADINLARDYFTRQGKGFITYIFGDKVSTIEMEQLTKAKKLFVEIESVINSKGWSKKEDFDAVKNSLNPETSFDDDKISKILELTYQEHDNENFDRLIVMMIWAEKTDNVKLLEKVKAKIDEFSAQEQTNKNDKNPDADAEKKEQTREKLKTAFESALGAVAAQVDDAEKVAMFEEIKKKNNDNVDILFQLAVSSLLTVLNEPMNMEKINKFLNNSLSVQAMRVLILASQVDSVYGALSDRSKEYKITDIKQLVAKLANL